MTTYRFLTQVAAIQGRYAVLAVHKDGDTPRVDRTSIGWWLTIYNSAAGDISFCLGSERPPFVEGDKIVITIAKAERD